ncbi:MAG: hypothetical protein RXS25_36940, partial [Paraburkholderia sp.]|uniref:hypothetical protein n=1 Tax=Paraburkholderia sp. TaxID=1926495 RepID=UPI003978B8F7
LTMLLHKSCQESMLFDFPSENPVFGHQPIVSTSKIIGHLTSVDTRDAPSPRDPFPDPLPACFPAKPFKSMHCLLTEVG